MILVTAASALLLALMLCVALWNLRAAPRLESFAAPPSPRRVSVLVPARNEADNLRSTLPALLRLDHPTLEIVVLDDGSTDETAAVVQAQAHGAGGRLRLLSGAPLPTGWLGKNWACHQLAEAATGDVLIFCDADVTTRPDAVSRTLGAMQAYDAGALTALPRQQLRGCAEAAVVPLVAQLPVLAMLPLALVPRTRRATVSMANGQWLAFTRAAYARCGGHSAARGRVVEDVALGRRVKAAGDRLVVAIATDTLRVGMYADAKALRAGFAKNLYALAGGRPVPFAAAVAVFTLTAVYPWVGALSGGSFTLLPLGLLLALRLCGAALFRHGVVSIALHPLGSLLVLAIAAESALRAYRGTHVWKGRSVADALPGDSVPEALATPGHLPPRGVNAP